jgi:hypothetical protein
MMWAIVSKEVLVCGMMIPTSRVSDIVTCHARQIREGCVKINFAAALLAGALGWAQAANATTQCAQQTDFMTMLKSCKTSTIGIFLKDKTSLFGTLTFVGEDYILLTADNKAAFLIPVASIQYVSSQ